jgi:hypothetical protein
MKMHLFGLFSGRPRMKTQSNNTSSGHRRYRVETSFGLQIDKIFLLWFFTRSSRRFHFVLFVFRRLFSLFFLKQFQVVVVVVEAVEAAAAVVVELVLALGCTGSGGMCVFLSLFISTVMVNIMTRLFHPHALHPFVSRPLLPFVSTISTIHFRSLPETASIKSAFCFGT